MPNLYTGAVRTAAAAAGAGWLEIRQPASPGARAIIREISIQTTAATVSSIGLIRALTTGTASTTQAGAACNPNAPAATVTLDTVWSVAPTIAGSPLYLRRFTMPAVVAGLLLWRFWPGEGLTIPFSLPGVLLWNFGGSSGSALDVHVVWEE